MKKIINIVLTLIIIMYCPYYSYGSELQENDLFAKSAILIDGDSNRVLYEKNAHERMANASTTKIMTCIVALENGKLDDIAEFSEYATKMPKVKLGASKGSKYKIEDLLYSLMLESHNDTAVAIAEHIGGSVEGYAKMMNEKAKSLGLSDTNFVTPNGLDAENHYTTAYDLAIISSYAIKNKEFLKIINTKSYSFSDLDGKNNFTVNNKDLFLDMYEGAFGVKTGFTGNAGYCFVGASKRDNKTFISVVLASGWPPSKTNKWKDTVKLMNFGNDNYEHRVLFESISDFKRIRVSNGTKKYCDTRIDGFYETLISDMDVVDIKYVLDKNVHAPVYEGQNLGRSELYINNKKITEFSITSKEYIQKFDFEYCMKKIINKYMIE